MQLIKKLFYIPLSLFLGFFYFVVFVVEGMQTLNDSVHEDFDASPEKAF
jgi:hypothetical protein